MIIMTTAPAGLSRTLAADLPSAPSGRLVLIEGWVHRRRVLGAVTFLIVRDRSGLAQSPQFYKQTMVGVFERVYETGPVFRAEPRDTARHLAEYTSLDAELGFISDHRDVLAVLRQALAGMTAAVRDEAGGAVDLLKVTVPEVPAEIPVVHFREALIIAGAPPDEPDLAPAHERAVGRWAAETHGSDFIAVEGYPRAG
jgi:nondiscriminating aspartyl-tRNA synthetase